MTGDRLTRRDALKRAAAIAAGAITAREAGLKARTATLTVTALTVAGRSVEIAITSASASTVRVSITPLDARDLRPMNAANALAERDWPKPAARLTSARAEPIRAGDLMLRVSADPLTVRIDHKD